MENNMNIIELTDDDGNVSEYELLDVINYENNDYIVIIEDDEDAEEVVILKIDESEDEQESYSGVEDEDVLYAVFDIFKERNADEFDFA